MRCGILKNRIRIFTVVGLACFSLQACKDSKTVNESGILLESSRNVVKDSNINGGTPRRAADGSKDSIVEEKNAAPNHYYVLEKDGEYGYEYINIFDGSVTETSKSLIMVRYLSSEKGRQKVEFKSQSTIGTITCAINLEDHVSLLWYTKEKREDAGPVNDSVDCQFVDVDIYSGGNIVARKNIRVTNDPLVHAIMYDVVNDKLRLYRLN